MHLHSFTPVPDEFFDVYLKDLSLGETKALLLIIRKTLGFRQSKNDKRFKTTDWISGSQFMKLTGCSNRTIAHAITALVKKDLIQVLDQKGNILSGPQNRTGKQRLYYRQMLRKTDGKPYEQISLTSEKNNTQPVKKVHTTIYNPTIGKQTISHFVWKDFLNQLHESPYRPYNIIAYFFEKKGLTFSSQQQADLALERHIQAAEKVQHFSDQQIAKATSYLINVFPRFTVETIYKHLTN